MQTGIASHTKKKKKSDIFTLLTFVGRHFQYLTKKVFKIIGVNKLNTIRYSLEVLF